MSRTRGHGTGHRRNGTKPGGYEYWSRRPGPTDPGKESKRICHRIERRRAKAETREAIVYCDGQNDEIEINEAIRQLSANGGGTVVVVGACTYEGTLEMADNVEVRGGGRKISTTTA